MICQLLNSLFISNPVVFLEELHLGMIQIIISFDFLKVALVFRYSHIIFYANDISFLHSFMC